jgi:AcrR family transcriptional regulator
MQKRAKKKPPTKYHHGDLRAALVGAAWSAVAKKGVEALSLRSLADALGVSHGAPAHHFPDKEALLDALKAEAFSRFADALVAGAKAPAALDGMGLSYVRFAVEHPHHLALMFREGSRPPSGAVLEQSLRAWAVLVDSVARQVGPARAADEDELHALAISAWAVVHGLSALWTQVTLPPGIPTGGPGAEALQRRAIAVLVAGMARTA